METFLGGLALLAVGGLVTTAIKYPIGFRRISRGLGMLSLAAAPIFLGYQWGHSAGSVNLYNFIERAKFPDAMAMVQSGKPPVLWAIIGIGFGAFMIFLTFLRPILGIPDQDTENSDREDEGQPPA